MKQIFKKLLSAIIFIFLLYSFKINAQLSINAQYRNRFEFRDGYKKLAETGSVPSAHISQRTRLTFSYTDEKFRLFFSPQDVRIWGDEQLSSSTGVYGDDVSISLFEAYTEIRLHQLIWFSVGRQQLVYDDQLLLAGRNWNQNGLAYDAVVLKYKPVKWELHLGTSWNSLSESNNLYPSDRIKSLNFLWLNHTFNDQFNMSFMHIASGLTETDTTRTINFRQTTGLHTGYKRNNLNVLGNLYYQYGQNQPGNTVNAFLIYADANYKINKLTTGFGIEYLSGNSKNITNQSKDNLFDPLYGARHKYFGEMDYFSSFKTHTNQGGIIDYYLYLDFQLLKSISIKNTGHYFQLAQTNPDTPSDKNLGYENDMIVKYKCNDWINLEFGYDFFLPTESLKTIQNINDNKFSQFIYVQLTIKPTLYKQNNQIVTK